MVPQVWSNGNFTSVAPIPDAAFDLYPRMHVASSGIVYMTSLVQTWSPDVSGTGTWAAPPNVKRQNGLCDYAPSVLYDVDKVLFAGGGNPPTANAETIDLSQAQLAWQTTRAMNFPRRQHNATILPDGTVLVTGGTRGGGDPGTAEAFNDLDPGHPVHIAEVWDPKTGQWAELAAEKTDRCYHSTAVLLPDGRVLSAGSGEFILNGSQGCLCPTGHGAGRGQRHPGRSRDHGDLPIWHRGLLGRCERGAPQPGGSAVRRPDPRWGQLNSDYLPGRRTAARA